jgi:hypothetical protein
MDISDPREMVFRLMGVPSFGFGLNQSFPGSQRTFHLPLKLPTCSTTFLGSLPHYLA